MCDPSAGECAGLSLLDRVRHAQELRQPAGAGTKPNGVRSTGWSFVRVLEPTARSSKNPILGCVTNVSENLQSCTEDGSGPPGVGFQELASNHPELLRSTAALKRCGGERPGGRRPRGCQVSVEKMSESKPTDDASSRIQGTVKIGAAQ